MQHKNKVAHLLSLITIIVWGTTFISTKMLLKDFSPVEILFFRFIMGYAALWAIYPKFLKSKSWHEEITFAMAGVSGVTLYFLFENIALIHTLASNVGIIVAVAPMFTALLAHNLLEGEKMEFRFLMGFLVAIVGIALVIFNGNFILKLNPIGDILAVLAALTWAVYSILMKKISAFGYNMIQCTRRVFLYGLLFMLPALLIFDRDLNFSGFKSLPNVFHIFYLGLGASAACFVTWNWAVGVLGAVKTSTYIYLVPLVTIVMSALFLGEKMTWMALLGTALTLVGIYISKSKITFK